MQVLQLQEISKLIWQRAIEFVVPYAELLNILEPVYGLRNCSGELIIVAVAKSSRKGRKGVAKSHETRSAIPRKYQTKGNVRSHRINV